jgi:hypothetical protein
MVRRLHRDLGNRASLLLTFAWSSYQPPASVSGPFAHLTVN